jgi:hypothetical protein
MAVSATAQLAGLLRDGVRLDWRDPARPDFIVPRGSSVRDQVTALLTPTAKPQTRHALAIVAEYRAVCLTLFTLNAQGAYANIAEACEAVQHEYRLVDTLGPDLADLIRAQAAEDYTAQAHLCPRCGGPEHDA